MNFACTFYISDPTGIPDGWPASVRPLGDASGPLRPGEQLKTSAELEEIKEALTPAMDAHNAAMEAAAAAIRSERRAEIADTISDFKQALNNWDTLTVSQQKAVLKRCVKVLMYLLDEQRVNLDK